MKKLRDTGVGNPYKGRNKDVEDAVTELLRGVVVPFYNERNPDDIYLRETGGTIITYHMYI